MDGAMLYAVSVEGHLINIHTQLHTTRPTLVRLAEHLEYDFRNIGKKSLNVMSGHTHEALADH